MRIDPGQNRTGEHNPERIERLEHLSVADGDTEDGMLHIFNREEVQRRRHLLVEREEHNSLHDENHRRNHLAALRAVRLENHLEEHAIDTDADSREQHMRDSQMPQHPGREQRHRDDAHDSQQQFCLRQRLEASRRVNALDQIAERHERAHCEHKTHRTNHKTKRQAELAADNRHEQHGDERADVDGHVVHRECAVKVCLVALVDTGQQRGRVRLENTIAAGDGTECDENEHLIGAVAEHQDDRAERDCALDAKHLIAEVAADRDIAVDHGTERTEYDKRLCIGHAEAADKERGQYRLQAVVAKTLPEFQEEQHIEGFLPVDGLRNHNTKTPIYKVYTCYTRRTSPCLFAGDILSYFIKTVYIVRTVDGVINF